jgi:methylmalonyl-CoA mutase
VTEKVRNSITFRETRLSDWELAARDELKGADPWKKLSVASSNLLLKPIYGREMSRADSFTLPRALTDIRGARAWFNCPRVVVTDPAKGNAMALEHLESGADGIFFELRGSFDYQRLLKRIEWPFCALHFATESNDPAHAKALNTFLGDVKGDSAGAWFGPSPTELSHPTFRFGGIVIDSTSPEMIGPCLATWLGKAEAVTSRAAVSIDLGPDFFLDIAVLRALRLVWQHIHDAKRPVPPLYIHANSRVWKNPGYEPHGNMLKSTSAAMAAVLGGADALTVDPEDASDATQRRVARNVAILLREESRMAKVADPLAGCYFIDDLTHQVSEVIWNGLRTSSKP